MVNNKEENNKEENKQDKKLRATNTRGELSLNFIILLVIALIVLAIVTYIFSTSMSKGAEDISSCDSKGGTCVMRGSSCPEGYSGSLFFKCEDDTQKCCIPVIKETN